MIIILKLSKYLIGNIDPLQSYEMPILSHDGKRWIIPIRQFYVKNTKIKEDITLENGWFEIK